jgi:hypothetical protein
MNPVKSGVVAALVTTATFFAVAEVLDVQPYRPIATRTDVFFQSDAGGLVSDAVTQFHERARGTHPLVYPCWTVPVHRLALALESVVPREVTATYGSRVLVNVVSGLGVGVLVFSLRRRGVPGSRLLLFAPLLLLGNGNALAAIPDHFGLSLGVLTAAFAAYVDPCPWKRRAVGLGLLAGLAFGVTVTNVVFPAGLLALLMGANARIPGRVCAALASFAALGLLAAVVAWSARPDIRARVNDRVGLYLTWKLTRDPALAATHVARGTIDSVVAPTPAVTRDNLDRKPMLTYQPAKVPYRLWPYDAVRSAGAACWLVLLGVGVGRSLRDRSLRVPAVALLAWSAGTLAFHTVWGDEYFLYTPHHAWAFVTIAVWGWHGRPVREPAALVVVIVVASLVTLGEYRTFLTAIPE